MSIVYMSIFRKIWIKYWESDFNVMDPGYHGGQWNAHYPVPALVSDNLYWRMPSYPTNELIAQWHLTGPGQKS